MPGPYRRLDVANVNQHVVTAKPEPKKVKAVKKAEPVKADAAADEPTGVADKAMPKPPPAPDKDS